MTTATQYKNAKEMAEEIQRLPEEAQRTIFNMVHGAIAISELYGGMKAAPPSQEAERPSA